MEILKPSNITYYELLRVCLRLYGLYLFITGLLDALILIPSFLNKSDFGMYFVLKSGKEAFIGIVDVCIGLSLFFVSSQITRSLTDQKREISVRAGELFYIVHTSLKFVLVLVIITFLDTLLVGIIILSILAINGDVEMKGFITLIIPTIFLVITCVLLINVKRIVLILLKEERQHERIQ